MSLASRRGLALLLALGACAHAPEAGRTPGAASGVDAPAAAPPPVPAPHASGPSAVNTTTALGFTSTDAPPPRELGLAAYASTQHRRGQFRMWHVRGVPVADSARVARVARAAGGDRYVVVPWSDDPELDFIDQHLDGAGRIITAPRPTAEAALAARRQRLDARVRLFLEQTRDAPLSASDRAALVAMAPDVVERELSVTRPPPAEPVDEATTDANARIRRDAERAALGQPTTPATAALAVFAATDDELLELLVDGDELSPRPEEVAAVLATWRQRYGARLAGTPLFEVTRPPRTLADARRAALELFLLCPAHDSGRALARPSAEDLLAIVTSTRWPCSWFVE